MSDKRTFEVSEKEEYIELNKLLKIEQIAQTGGHARILIENGEVSVNNEIESRIRRKLRKGDLVRFQQIEVEIV